jgi:peptidyl-prolyl cis-trans isomerase, PPIC-type
MGVLQKRFTFLASLLFVVLGASNAQLLDGTIANVGTRQLLYSDVEMEMVRARIQNADVKKNTACGVLEGLLVHYMLLDQADLDSIPVQSLDNSQEIEQRLAHYIQQAGSEEALEKQYGRTLAEIRQEMAELLGEQRRSEQVRAKIVDKVSVTPSEVRAYFASQPADSLQMLPEQFIYRQLVLSPLEAAEAEFQVKEKLLNLRERILKGERFSTLAVAYSEDRGSAIKGGEMGYMPREGFVKSFADAAFALKDGQVSPIVKTEYGYHLIQMIGKKGKLANVRHILMRPSYSSAVLALTSKRLDSIKMRIQQDSITFEEACLKYSDDKDTRLNGGFAVNPQVGGTSLDKETMMPVDYYAIKELKEGEMSAPFESRDRVGNVVIKIIRLERIIPPHRMNLKEDYALVQNLAKQEKERKVFDAWIEKKQNNMYIWLDDRYADCPFRYAFWKSKMTKKL